MQMIVDLILDDLPKDDINYNYLRYYLEKPNLMTYWITNDIKVEELINFYDPLYSYSYIRERVNNETNILISINFESIDEGCEEIESEDSRIYKGFAKYKYSNSVTESYEWRKCLMKDLDVEDGVRVRFECFEKKCKYNII